MGHLYAELAEWAKLFSTYCRMRCVCLLISKAELKCQIFVPSLTWCAFPTSKRKRERHVSKLPWPKLTDGLNWCGGSTNGILLTLSLSKVFSVICKNRGTPLIWQRCLACDFKFPFPTLIIQYKLEVFFSLHGFLYCYKCPFHYIVALLL